MKYDHSKDSKRSVKEHFDRYFKEPNDNIPVFIYSHGNDADRAGKNRIKLCTKLNKLGYHVFAIDYRGYGDSTGSPTEEGLVKDVINLYNFIKTYRKDVKIYLWGHSLGTGVSCHVGKVLTEFNNEPAGVILEAPFMNISQAMKEYIIAPLILNNPWMIKRSIEAVDNLNIRFNNDKK
jgi:alpha-beta hydrolase superfamily lysophospholipase